MEKLRQVLQEFMKQYEWKTYSYYMIEEMKWANIMQDADLVARWEEAELTQSIGKVIDEEEQKHFGKDNNWEEYAVMLHGEE